VIRSWAFRLLSSILAATQLLAQPSPSRLNIAVLEGDNAVNSIPLGSSVTPVVEVRDANDFPVEGAVVVFTLPASGPGGTFPGNQNSYSTRSDSHGQASAPFLVNGLPGKFAIKVTATSGSRMGEASITQSNSVGAYVGVAPAKRPLYKRWYTWAIAGGAVAVVLAVVLTRGGKSSVSTAPPAAPPVIVVTPGPPVFGGPQ
jgi:hypothetical protein